MSPNIGFSFFFALATSVILFLINFHYSFFLLDTDAALHIAYKAISPIPKLSILNLSFSFHESSNKKEFLKVTPKQQTDYLFKQLPMSKSIPKHYFYFTFLFFDLSQTENIFKLHISHWCLNFTLR